MDSQNFIKEFSTSSQNDDDSQFMNNTFLKDIIIDIYEKIKTEQESIKNICIKPLLKLCYNNIKVYVYIIYTILLIFFIFMIIIILLLLKIIKK